MCSHRVTAKSAMTACDRQIVAFNLRQNRNRLGIDISPISLHLLSTLTVSSHQPVRLNQMSLAIDFPGVLSCCLVEMMMDR
mmetsp:Transcript_6435/g.14743  ORF Transcript_6435/g.14743 Transcript_6435/m.14743 type:complete len:81 (+) Transcript_6435:1144-1386(+)